MLGSFVLIAFVSHAAIPAPGTIQSTAARQPPAASKPATPEKPWPPPGVIRMSKDITAPRLIKESKPQYTADARRAAIQGVVHLEAVIQTDGTVGEVRVSQSLDKQFGLDEQAVQSLKTWRFTPGQKDGAAIPVLVEIEMSFTLR